MNADEQQAQGATSSQEATQNQPTNQEISEDVIREHPLYKQLLSESIERRKTIAELKNKLDSQPLETTLEVTQQTETSDPLARVMQELADLKQSLTQTTVQAKREAVIAKYQIPEDLHDFISASDPEGMEAQAEKLAQLARKAPKPTPQDKSDAGGNNTPTESDLHKRVLSRINGTSENSNPMHDPNLAVRFGGGVSS